MNTYLSLVHQTTLDNQFIVDERMPGGGREGEREHVGGREGGGGGEGERKGDCTSYNSHECYISFPHPRKAP